MSQRRHEQLQREQQFWALVRQGIGFSAACEAAGVHRRQGYRWRKAASGRLPTAPRVVSKRYLCLQERLTIADLHLNGHGIRAIAAAGPRALHHQPRTEPQRPSCHRTRSPLPAASATTGLPALRRPPARRRTSGPAQGRQAR